MKAEPQKSLDRGCFQTEDSSREKNGDKINNKTVQSGLELSLSDTCSVQNRSEMDAFFELFNYKTVLSRNTENYAEAIGRNRNETRVVQQRLLQKRKGVRRNGVLEIGHHFYSAEKFHSAGVV